MFGVSIPEILIVLALLLIVVGPDRLPQAAQKFGKFMSTIRRQTMALRREFYSTLNEAAPAVPQELKDLKSDINSVSEAFIERKDPLCPDYVPEEEEQKNPPPASLEVADDTVEKSAELLTEENTENLTESSQAIVDDDDIRST